MEASTVQSFQIRCVMSFPPFLLSILFMAFPLFVFSQNKMAEKANELFKQEQYTPAAVYYEDAIKEMEAKGKSTRSLLNLRTKLAFCYRVNNRMEEAEATYAKVVAEDRAKSQTYFFYGETLMANGKYDEAKKWFANYQKLEPEDEKVGLMIRACDEVKFIEPYFEFVDVQPFPHNSDADDNAAMAWEDGIVFSSDRSTDRKIKVNILEEKAGWTGRDYLDIYFSKKNEDGTYKEPKQFSGKLSELNKNTGNTSFSLDGSEVFFTRNDNILNKQKTYNLQLFSAEKDGNKWRNVTKLPFCSPNYNFMHPAISPDGKMLFFATNKGGGQGGTDIWVSIREKDGKWSKPENLGPSINTSANEGFPFMDKYGRLYFCSKGHVGYGGFDIFFTEMTGSGMWKNPVNLGEPINSPLDDISIYVDGERKHGMFSSSRNGGDDDIFIFDVLEEAPPVVEEIVEKSEPEIIEEKKVSEPQVAQPKKTKRTGLRIAPARVEIIEKPKPKIEEKEVVVEEIIPEPEIVEPEKNELIIPEEIEEVVEEPEPELTEEAPVSEPVKEEITIAEEIEIEEKKNEVEEPQKEMAEVEEIEAPVLEFTAKEEVVEIPMPTEIKTEEKIEKSSTELAPFYQFLEKAAQGGLEEGDRYRVDNAIFDPEIWQLTPNISKKLDQIVTTLRRFPSLNIELSSHTETLGAENKNLRISEQRAEMVKSYIVREGISESRLSTIGYGKSMPLNECGGGVPCNKEEHLFNQRLEIKVMPWGRKQ